MICVIEQTRMKRQLLTDCRRNLVCPRKFFVQFYITSHKRNCSHTHRHSR